MDSAQEQQVKGKGYQELENTTYVAASIAFNEKDYPYNLLAVRQALAYVINRQTAQEIGEPVVGQPSLTTSGVMSSTLPQFLTSSQQSALNTYANSTAKATSLLKGAGFTLKSGQWYMPNGKPWTITLHTSNGFTDWQAASSAIKSELGSFGIPTSISFAATYNEYLQDLFEGQYAVGWWLMALGPSGYAAFSRLYGVYDGWAEGANGQLTHSTGGNATQGNFLNMPTTLSNVPGYGTVNPEVLNNDLNNLNLSTASGLAQYKQDMAELIAATNYDVPAIQIWDYIGIQWAYDARWTDNPPSGTSGQDQALLSNTPGVWMAYGYVHAAS
jgi:peptide/nickel transport system substrate-binding protein